MTSARIYRVAEQRIEDERYPEAVRLMQHVVEQLPPGNANGAMRHRLVLRTGYVHLLAFEQTRDRAFLEAAERDLSAYVIEHEAAFGDGESARAARGEVYELLYSVDSFAEADDALVAANGSPSKPPPAVPEVEDVEEVEEPVDDHAGETVDGDMHRTVHVRDSRLASLDDPRVKERLISSAAAARTGLVLTGTEITMLNGARALVRLRPVDIELPSGAGSGARRDAVALARDTLDSARGALLGCYELAFSRSPELIVELTAKATLLADGSVTEVRIKTGGLVDGLGDVCLLEALAGTQLDPGRAGEVQLPLVFFFDGPKGRRTSQAKVSGSLPTIDEFFGIVRPRTRPVFQTPVAAPPKSTKRSRRKKRRK